MIVDCAVYERGKRRPGKLGFGDAHALCEAQGDAFAWIGLYEPTESEFDTVRREFDLHELAVEDAIHAHQRPKLELYGDTVFLVLKTVRYVGRAEVVETGEILVFLGERFVITVRHGSATELHDVRESLERHPERLRKGTSVVLHAILDRVVDDYLPALEGVEAQIEAVEEQVFSPGRPGGETTQRIYQLKREVLEFSHAAAPLIEPVAQLASGRHEIVHPAVRAYFRDVDDHLRRVHEQLEGFGDLLNGVLEANLTQVGIQQNEDMRKISAWVAIAAVPTLIAAIYGMNFDDMPELRWGLGYPAVLVVMAVVCCWLYWRFKRAGWL